MEDYVKSVYVVSSWKNKEFDNFLMDITDIRDAEGDPCYLICNFKTKGLDYHNTKQDLTSFNMALKSPQAQEIIARDTQHLINADIVILLLPCGKSAHMELGCALGMKKECYVVLNGVFEPEITYLMIGADNIFATTDDMHRHLRSMSPMPMSPR